MAIEVINRGTSANDGTGDNIREAFRKVNDNFAQTILKDIDTLPAATTPLVGTEPLIVLQDGELKQVAASDLGGGGGSSLRTAKYEWFNGTNTFVSTTNWYGARRNVANQLPLPLWSSGESYYDGATSHVTNTRMPSYIIDFNQKIERLSFTYERITVGFTFRLIYYELNPSGTTNNAVNDQVIYEAVIAANTGGFKKQEIFIPADFTATKNGYFAIVIYNNSGSTLTAPNWQITANAIEVI